MSTALLQQLAPPGAETALEGGVPRITGEFWTARQRQAMRLHEVSYRACFKPQLPAFFMCGVLKRRLPYWIGCWNHQWFSDQGLLDHN